MKYVTLTSSNHAQITDIEGAKALVKTYRLSLECDIVHTKIPTITFYSDCWPSAIDPGETPFNTSKAGIAPGFTTSSNLNPLGNSQARLVRKGKNDNQTDDKANKKARIHQENESRFMSFLKKLAIFLKTPLTIQAVTLRDNISPMLAKEWVVRPGCEAIEVNGFKYTEAC